MTFSITSSRLKKQVDTWDELPESVKNTYEKLGILKRNASISQA